MPMPMVQMPIDGDTPGPFAEVMPAEPPRPATPAAIVAAEVAPAEADALGAVRTRPQLEAELRRLGSRGGTVLVANDAKLTLSTIPVPKGARLTIQSVPGRSRPMLRYAASEVEERASTEAEALFRIAPGAALELSGIDVVVEAPDGPEGRRTAAFALGAGSDLTLVNASVTVSARGRASGDPLGSASVVAVVADPAGAGVTGSGDASAASVRVSEGLLRSAGDLVDVGAGGRLEDLSLANVVAACSGSLVHGHGLPRGQSAQPIKLVLRQVTARAEGGLVRLESAPGEPELPVARVIARDAILATTATGAPLVRIEGQDGLDVLRDRVPWEGHSVFYHQIDTYRRDQTALSGTSPVGFKRPSWEVAVGPSEDAPGHGDARFARPWPSDRSPWTIQPADVALDPDSPAQGSGADLDRIPPGPSSSRL
jgi:hypothetical protein